MAFFEDQTSQGAVNRFLKISEDGNESEGVMLKYKQWAKTFDRDFLLADPKEDGTRVTTETFVKMCPDKEAHILDVCAGTGGVGKQLKRMGFHNLDALDGCQDMLDEAAKKNIYKKLICHLLGKDRIPIDDNEYDGLLCQDGFYPGHVEDGACFSEFVRIVKPGGAIVLMMEASHLHRYEMTLKKMADDGKWKYDIFKCECPYGNMTTTVAMISITVN